MLPHDTMRDNSEPPGGVVEAQLPVPGVARAGDREISKSHKFTVGDRSETMRREWYIKHDRKFRTTLRAIIRT